MTKTKRLHIYAGIILEKYNPDWVTSTVGDTSIVKQLEKIVGETLRGRSTSEVYNILENIIENGLPSQPSSIKKKDAYDHAMSVI